MIILEDDKIVLRAPEPEDLDLLYLWENDSSAWEAGNTRAPYSRFQLRQYVASLKNDLYSDGALRLMITDKATKISVGTVDLFDFDPHHSRVALGLFVHDKHRGKSYARMALLLTEKYVFEFLKLNQLYVQIAASNSASIRLFEGNYQLHGKLKAWIKTPNGFDDILNFQKFLSDYKK